MKISKNTMMNFGQCIWRNECLNYCTIPSRPIPLSFLVDQQRDELCSTRDDSFCLHSHVMIQRKRTRALPERQEALPVVQSMVTRTIGLAVTAVPIHLVRTNLTGLWTSVPHAPWQEYASQTEETVAVSMTNYCEMKSVCMTYRVSQRSPSLTEQRKLFESIRKIFIYFISLSYLGFNLTHVW